ncbi:hypothetical protein L249_3387, partial [Ophiocordyceps polyrhachis-furcata BCC 54312]
MVGGLGLPPARLIPDQARQGDGAVHFRPVVTRGGPKMAKARFGRLRQIVTTQSINQSPLSYTPVLQHA